MSFFSIPTEKLSPLCNLLHIYISWKWKGQSYGKYHKVELFHYLLKLLHEMLVYMYYGTSILKHYLQSLLTFLRKFCALLNNPKSFHFKTRNKHIFLAIYDDQVLFLCFVMLSESEKFSLNRQKLFTELAIWFWRFIKI